MGKPALVIKMLTKHDKLPMDDEESEKRLGTDSPEEDASEFEGAAGDVYDALKSGTKEDFVAAIKNLMACEDAEE